MRWLAVAVSVGVALSCSPPRTEAPMERQVTERPAPANKMVEEEPITQGEQPTAFSYEIVEHVTPEDMARDSLVTVMVKVKNTSSRPWPKKGPIKLGFYWLDMHGERVEKLEGRIPVWKDTSPGAATYFRCRVKAPGLPGSYRLMWDMIEEKVAWFGSKGAKPVRVAVTVR